MWHDLVGHFLIAILLVGILSQAAMHSASAQSAESTESKQAIVELLKKCRRAAEHADADAYFGCFDKKGIFFGTDGNERFTLPQLKAFLGPYFAQGIGWKHDVKQRHVYVGPHDEIGWFEEQTERVRIGPMRTTGVVRKTDNGWKIVQYNVAIVIPNEAVEQIVAIICKTEELADADKEAADTRPMSEAEHTQMEESFEYVWRKIRDSYWDPDLGGVDWQAAYDELKPKLDEATTRAEAIQVLEQLVSRMQVSHFSIIPKTAYEELGRTDEKGAHGGVTGMDVRIVDDQVIVVAVHEDSPAAAAGVRAGWMVEEIADINAPAKLADVQQELEGNPHARVILASAANSRLRGRVGDEITVTFRDGKSELIKKTFELVPDRGQKVQFGHLPEFRVWVETKSIGDGIGYFRFNAFMNPTQVMTAYNQFMKEHEHARGIIIDVRGNGGGMGGIAMGMIAWLMPGEKASLGKVILRDNELNMNVRPRPKTYSGRVVVLIDELSVSAAEFFASGIQDLTEARLIGTCTAGAVLGSQIEKLPTGDGFQFAAANFISIRTGKTLEGVGVAPHQVVEPNREMLLAGKDPAIEAAVQWIESEDE